MFCKYSVNREGAKKEAPLSRNFASGANQSALTVSIILFRVKTLTRFIHVFSNQALSQAYVNKCKSPKTTYLRCYLGGVVLG